MVISYIKRQAFSAGGGGPPGAPDLKSIDFDGSTEYLRGASSTLGIANVWTKSVWVMFDAHASTYSVLAMRGGNNNNRFQMDFITTGADFIRIWMYSSAGSRFKDWAIPATNAPVGVWTMWSHTWDGTNLKIYINGSEFTSPITKNTDDSGTMSDTSRQVGIATLGDLSANFLNGKVHSTAMWSVVLTEEQLGVLHNSGEGALIDYREAQGAYTSTEVDAMEHYWRHGFNSGDIGEDLGNGTAIDVGDESANITAADIEDDYPGI